ncbi:MAG: YlxR family protein [Polyangiaceae bacterium]
MANRDENERDPKLTERHDARSQRTCVGCGEADDASALVRLVLGPRSPGADGAAPIAVDFAGGTHGRGAHVHARPDCLSRAAKSGLSRSFKAKVECTADDLARQIVDGSDRRITGLLAGAWRARMAVAGADAATAALDSGAPLAVVATDAGSLIERGAIGRAIAEGRAVAWKDKQTLGALFGGRGEVAVCAVLNDSIATEIASARTMADAVSGGTRRGDASDVPPGGGQGPGRGTACRSREAR